MSGYVLPALLIVFSICAGLYLRRTGAQGAEVCRSNAFDGLHSDEWLMGGKCSYCAAVRITDGVSLPAGEPKPAKATDEGSGHA